VRILSAASALLLLAIATGVASAAPPNGEAGKTIPQILADVQTAADHAQSVYVLGSDSSGSSPFSLNLRLMAGRGGKGTIDEGGLSFQIVRIGGKAYFEGAAAFWRHFAGAGGAELFKGKWIEAPATSGQFASLTSLTSITQLFHQILGSHGTLVEGKTTMIRGRAAIALVDKTEGGTLYVAATGPPYPLELTSPDGKGSVNFEDWNQSFRLDVPPHPIALASIKG
jgi:hypothetical protein